jgi:transposase-like protein/DNA-directed RNA polymerase subunit M/transcription elongation factor TFIIS
LAIVARGDQIQSTGPGAYTVQSQSRPGSSYAVTVRGRKASCPCAFNAQAGTCIHGLAVLLQLDLKASDNPEEQRVACPKCRAKAIHYGVRQNKSGPVKLYLCKACGHRFSGREGFQRRRTEPKTIALALDLYFRGLSLRKVADHFEQVHGLKVSPMTIYRWVAHYGRLAAEWMDAQGATTGQRWHVDETVVKVDGGHRYLWNVLDADSRFLLATHVSKNRTLAHTRAPLKKAKKVASQKPSEVFTDGMGAYRDAIGKELGHRLTGEGAGGSWFNPHRRVPSIRAPESNNRIERFHGTEKERIKVMRGFDGAKGTATLMEGFRAHYNLVRTHSALGMTPAEAAGFPHVPGFRWSRILQEATRNDTPAKTDA